MARPVLTRRVPALFALLCAALGLLECGSREKGPARGSVNVTVYAHTSSAPATVKLTVQCPGVMPGALALPLPDRGGQYGALINNLPIASNYLFTADAFDGSGLLMGHGVVDGVSVINAKTTEVIIYLSDVARPPRTTAPLIDSITYDSGSSLPGGDIALSATAHDPDAGQTATLVFTWLPAAGCGAISKASSAPGTSASHPAVSRATWTAPQTLGDCTITLWVTDVGGLANSASFTIKIVGEARGTGSTVVSPLFNGPPAIAALMADPAQLSADGPSSGIVEALVTDPEGDTLTYAWSTPADSQCAIEFATPTEASTSFTITTPAAGTASCTFLLSVSDGVWPGTGLARNTSTASLTLAVTHGPVVRTPPVFGVAYQSQDSASIGSIVMFGTIASDPTGGTLTFDWSATSGLAPVPADPKSLNLDPAFVAASTWTVPSEAGTAASGLAVSVTATSSTTLLKSSFTFSLVPASP